MGRDLRRGAGADDLAAAVAALGPEVDDPVGGADDVEVVLDHQQRVSRGQQLAERTQQLRYILEVQSGRRLVKQEQLAAMSGAGKHRARLGEMPRQFQALSFATRQGGYGLAELHILQANIGQRCQPGRDFLRVGKEGEAFSDRHVEHFSDVRAQAVGAFALDVQDFVAIALAVAVRAAQIHVREELHLDVLEAVTRAGRAAAVAGVEAEGTGGVLAFLRGRFRCEDVTDGVERPNVTRWIGASGPADRGLVDHHNIIDQLGAPQTGELPGSFGGFAPVLQQSRVQNILNERRFPGSRHPGHADQALQRDADVDVLQVVLGNPVQFQPAVGDRLGDDLAGSRRLDGRLAPFSSRPSCARSGTRL